MELTGKQKSKLKSLAQTKKAMFQVGKEGFTPSLIQQILEYLKKHELGKIVILDTCFESKAEIEVILEKSGIDVVQLIGKTFVLYRQNPSLKDRIEL